MLMIALRIMFILVTCGVAALLLILADCLVNVTLVSSGNTKKGE